MTFPDSVQWNTLEEVLSSDLNRLGGLAGKAVQDLAADIESGIDLSPGPRACVTKGLDGNPGVGLALLVSAGTIVQFDPSAPGNDASQYLVGRLDDDLSVALPASDGALPLVSLVYATITQTLDDSTIRNVLTLPSRVVTPTPIFKSSRPTLTLASVAGTPAANPTLPAGPAGSIPLWYVYQPAASVLVDPNTIIDGRFRFNPSPLSRSHGRDWGMLVDVSLNSLSSVTIGSGLGFADGARVDHQLNQTFSGISILPSGAGALTASTEYSVYAVTIGQGPLAPVGKAVTSQVVFVLSTIAPTPEGRPSAALQYRPLFGLGFDALLVSTDQALWIGTISTDASGTDFQIGGDGIPLNRDGTLRSLTASQMGGFPGFAPGWIRAPELSYVDASTVSVGLCSPIIGGVPGLYGGGSAALPVNLVSGEVETPSTFYYLYLRPAVSPSTRTRGTVRHYVLRLSSVAPSAIGNFPAPETGFFSFEYIYVGCFYNDAAGDIRAFRRVGGRTILLNALNSVSAAAVPTLPTRLQLPFNLPLTSRIASVIINPAMFSGAAGAAEGDIEVFQDNATPGYTARWRDRFIAGGVSEESWQTIAIDIPTTQPSGLPGDCEARVGQTNLTNATFNIDVWQTGWVEQLSV